MDLKTFEKDLIVTYEAVFKATPKIERHSQDNREGNPVMAIAVNGGLVVYPTPVQRPSLSGFTPVDYIAIDRVVPSTENPELDADDYEELALVPTEAEAIAIVVAEMARDIALQVATGEAMARVYGEG